MTNKMLKKIGASFRESIKGSLELGDIMQKHISSLKKIKADEEDSLQLTKYIKQVELSREERMNTKKITDFIDDLVFCIFNYVLYLNSSNEKIYVTISSRRKSLVSELRKTLRNIIHDGSGAISDRFSLRYIIENCFPDELQNEELLYNFTNKLINLLCYEIGVEKFLLWCQNNLRGFEVMRIADTLSVPFDLVVSGGPKETDSFDPAKYPTIVVPKESGIDSGFRFAVKDYVFEPKNKGYQGLHFVLHISSSSLILPGLFIEFQGRTSQMDVHAEDPNSDAYHESYKESTVDKEIVKTFTINAEEVVLKGFDFQPAPDPTPKQKADGVILEDYLKDRAGLVAPIFPQTRSILSA